MKIRGIVTLVTMVAFLFVCSTQDLRAATEAQTARTHAVSQSDLHQAVQVSQQQSSEALKSVQDFFARAEVKTQIQRFGLAPERLSAQVAMLSDSDLAKLQKQIMSLDVQKETAGLSGAAIALIVIGGVVLIIVIALLLVWAADENGVYYY